MVPLSISGLNWCAHAGWMIVLYDTDRRRRLQITLRLEDALVVGQELARQPSDRSALYALVGTLVRQQSDPVSVNLALTDGRHAATALVVSADADQKRCAIPTADAVALAVRAGLPLFADEELMATFGVGEEPDRTRRPEDAGGDRTTIPHVFRLALDDPPSGDTAS